MGKKGSTGGKKFKAEKDGFKETTGSCARRQSKTEGRLKNLGLDTYTTKGTSRHEGKRS
jgi:hypothetical protein